VQEARRERAPLGRNTELLTHLIDARPAHLCPLEVADRLLSLMRQPLLLPTRVSAALMRWNRSAHAGLGRCRRLL
jgi:hypothetical protein